MQKFVQAQRPLIGLRERGDLPFAICSISGIPPGNSIHGSHLIIGSLFARPPARYTANSARTTPPRSTDDIDRTRCDVLRSQGLGWYARRRSTFIDQ